MTVNNENFTNCSKIYQDLYVSRFEAVFEPKLSLNYSERE